MSDRVDRLQGAEIDAEYWGTRDEWSLDEAQWLLVGVAPGWVWGSSANRTATEESSEVWTRAVGDASRLKVVQRASSAIEQGVLGAKPRRVEGTDEAGEPCRVLGHFVCPRDFIEWCETKPEFRSHLLRLTEKVGRHVGLEEPTDLGRKLEEAERIIQLLGSALWCVNRCPAECGYGKGVTGKRIYRQINKHYCEMWPDGGFHLMGARNEKDIINDWLVKGRIDGAQDDDQSREQTVQNC